MSEYEGLNLPELLDRLHPIVLPEPVPFMPATPGWWAVGLWAVTLALLAGWHWRRRWRANAYRREALALLAGPDVRSGDAIAGILKRTALAAFGRADVASLQGADWAEFLVTTSRADPEVAASAEALARAAYQPDADPEALLSPARRWVLVHRA